MLKRLLLSIAIAVGAIGVAIELTSDRFVTMGTEAARPILLFGLGPTANSARDSELNQQAPLGMYTTWYTSSSDLDWMSLWENTLVPETYASGRAMHLITWSGGAETGTPCGRQYPISDRINDDMVRLAQIFAGDELDPPLYVTLFTEFQTYPCVNNMWSGAEDYYVALQAKMLEVQGIFHEYAPNSQVSIGWGGWQSRWDGPATGSGRSLIPHFDSVSRAMDFQSFQAMQADSNVDDIRQMTQTLGAYGPVMVAHHKPDGFHPDVFYEDISTMMTDDFLTEVTGSGLFAWSFMDHAEMSASTSVFDRAREAVLRYTDRPCEGDACDIDSDTDGCTDKQELGSNPLKGGRRDPLNPWDFYDVVDTSGNPPGDGIVDLLNDTVGVMQHYSPSGAPPYDVVFDRGPSSGPDPWNMTAPDGSIDLFNDILGVFQQLGHDCTAAR